MDVGIVLALLGILIGGYFGMRSIFQSNEMESLQIAVRANSQAMYNNLWRGGAQRRTIETWWFERRGKAIRNRD